jgi:hypothetical protein
MLPLAPLEQRDQRTRVNQRICDQAFS